MENATEKVTGILQETLVSLGESAVAHTPFLVAGMLVVLLTWIAARVSRRVSGRLLGRSGMRQSLRELVQRFVGLGIWSVGLLAAAMIVFPGLTPAKALGGLGLVSVAVGLAFRDIFENFFAGVLILWRFPFENGDFIECEGIVGRVEDTTIRMTRIRKTTGELVLVPNSVLFKNPVDVLTDRGKRRITIMAGVAYDEDVASSVEVIRKAVEGCESPSREHPIEVFPQAFGASSIDIEVTWWTDPEPLDLRRSRGEVVTAVKKALDEAGIEIPFPYRTLTFKEPLPLRGLEDREPKGASNAPNGSDREGAGESRSTRA